ADDAGTGPVARAGRAGGTCRDVAGRYTDGSAGLTARRALDTSVSGIARGAGDACDAGAGGIADAARAERAGRRLCARLADGRAPRAADRADLALRARSARRTPDTRDASPRAVTDSAGACRAGACVAAGVALRLARYAMHRTARAGIAG